MAAPQASSRLELLQARFQQKQLQEKEQKLLQLYDQQQQRAYQVVQRGSAGSNSSNHATSISQHTVTKTSSSSHTTSTSQGGKVRQMFDERRQTTVKGIDRSYPLEPLENKSRKQTNGNGVQKNGNLTVNRQSVTVKRVARADVNSNLNGGKPIVSYHEEISRESFDPCARQHQEDDEFGNENHVAQYANGNHRDETRTEEVLDEDMIERNRMMAKLHLMEYDETLKHRVKNDLENEEFPEDFMVDVPDKLPKQNVTRKLSQAEIRLERFKNANARRGNNVTKNPAIAPKKRSDPIFPVKSTCSGSRMTKTASDRRSNDGKNPASSESRGKTVVSGNVGKTVSLDSGRNVGRRDENPRFFCGESEKSATAHAVGSKTARKLSPGLSEDRIRRSERSAIFNKEKSAIKYPIDSKAARTLTSESVKDKTGKRESRELSSKDAGKSTVTSTTGATTARKLSSEALKDVKDQGDHGKFIDEESEKLAMTYAIDSKTAEKYTREATKDTRDLKRRNESPKFFCKESEKSATTYAIRPKPAERQIREVSKDTKGIKRRSESPKFFCKESDKSATTYAIDSKTAENYTREATKDTRDLKRRSESPKFFCKESEKSATTYEAIYEETNKRFSLGGLKDVKERSDSPKPTTYAIGPKSAERSIRKVSEGIKDVKRRSESPRFFCEGSERSAKTYVIDRKAANSSKTRTPRRDSPKFFCKESEKSATTYAIDSTILPTSPNYMKGSKSSVLKIESKNKKDTTNNTIRKSTNDAMKRHATYPKRDTIRKSSSPEGPKYDVISCAKPKYQTLPKSTEIKLPDVFERLTRRRSSSPRSLGREGRKSATTMSICNRDTESTSVSAIVVEEMIKKGSESGRVSSGKRDASIIHADKSKSPDFAKVSSRSCSVSPQYFGSDSDRSASILMVTPETIVKAKTDLACFKKREQSPTSYIAKGEKLVTNVPREATRGSSTESYDETAKRFIRSSVSRFFLEQCEAAARNVEPRKHQLTDARTQSRTESQFDDGRAEKDERTSFVTDGSRDSSPRSREIVESREETPEFLRYETEKSAIATSLKSKTCTDVEQPPKAAHSLKQTVAREMTARPRNLSSNVKDRSSKIPLSVKDDNLTAENTNALSRRGSAGVLRSTKLIRDVLQRQTGQDQVDYTSHGTSGEWEERPRADRMQAEETRVDRKVEERAGTPAGRQFAAAGSESCRSEELDTQIGEIRTPERCVKQEQLRGTYSRSSKGTACEKSSVGKLLTYSVRKPVKQRGSLLEWNIFQQSLRDRKSADERPISSKRTTRIASLKKEPAACARSLQSRTKGNVANGKNESNILKTRGRTASLISASSGKMSSETIADKWNVDRYDASKRITRTSNESIARGSKGATDVADRSGESKISRTGAQTTKKQSIADERKKGKTSKQAEVLKSMKLVRGATRGSDFEQESRKMVGESVDDGTVRDEQQTETRKSCCPSMIDIRRSEEAGLASIKELSKNYERTDSVESALRRFDSIGTEAGSMRGTLERSVESIPKEIRRKSGGSIGRKADSKTISPKALDPPNVNLLTKITSCASKATTVSRSAMVAAAKERQTETQETRRQKKLEKARDSIEISRIAIRSRSLSCKRKLFQHTDSSETGSVASRCSIDSLRTVERLSTTCNKKKTRDSVNTACKRFEFSGSDETSCQMIDKAETDKTSTGVGRCSSTKQLRSIEDIRRSMEDENWDRETGQPSATSAIIGSAAKAASRSEPRRINVNDRAGNRKEICSSGRSVNVTASNDALGDADRSSVKCAMRFSRVAKSPSPETTKETSIRARRNVPASPSKSPDTVARRASSELKAPDTRSTKRPTTMKGTTEPIGNRKTLTVTSMTTKKSADVVDSTILENGLHLQDQTAETKYDNDSPTKKTDALVVDLDEQSPKENDAPLARKPLLRKQSTEKQITSMQSTRPPSVSSAPGGSSMQGQTSGSRSKMASRAKTPISGSTGYKGSASSRTGGAAAAATCYNDALVPCKMCGRRFAQDRVTLHEQICAKTTQKKRKQFDTMMYRVKGTDLEPFVKKGLVKKQVEKSKKPEIKSNWRRKHEDFINAIRSAKQVQAHLAAGGKLSDLPPPPVSDNYDYIQCPHCGRKFNKAAAERHIPKCEHMLHNKPIHSRAPKPRR